MEYLAQLLIAFFVTIAVYHWTQPRLLLRRKARVKKAWVKRLRLSKMLEFIGLDLDMYVKAIPSSMVEEHIWQCQNCQNTQQCDDCLLDKRHTHDMHFCPNYDSLMRCSFRFCKTH